MNIVIPPLLKKGDKIAVVAPAGKVAEGSLSRSIRILQGWGLNVITSPHVYGNHNYFSASDDERLVDLQQVLDDNTITAVLCARGGYGTTRILDRLDFSKFMEVPKWVIGFSDITALHLKLNRLRVASIHGPMATTISKNENAGRALQQLLFDSELTLKSNSGYRPGSAEAPLVGGNLSLLIDSLGTANELESKGKILFIEEVGEQAYRIDRMMYQLLRAGKLHNLAGLAIGHFSEISESKTPFGQSYKEIIAQIVKKFSYPIAFDFEIGHEPNNYPVVCGASHRLIVTEGGASLQLVF